MPDVIKNIIKSLIVHPPNLLIEQHSKIENIFSL